MPGGRRSKVGADLFAATIIEHRLGPDKKPFGLAGGVGFVAAFISDFAHAYGFQYGLVAVRNLDAVGQICLSIGRRDHE
ncbi:hypothetical protein D3C84_997800 [compost metagenome]